MGKKPHSTMTSSDFVRYIAALGGRYNTVAPKLKRTAGMISLYASGARPIPLDVEVRLKELFDELAKLYKSMGHKLADSADERVGNMIVVTNELKMTAARNKQVLLPVLHRRMEPEDSRVYPAYRLPLEKFRLAAEALAVYHAACVNLHKKASTETEIKAYTRELADLRVIADNMKGIGQRGAPYDMLITHSEWNVVSRALRHDGTMAKRSIYQHWRKFKGSGYPVKRSTN